MNREQLKLDYMETHVDHNKVIYVDMDDTICNFSKSYHRKLFDQWQIRWPQSQYGFFTGLEPIEGAIHCMNVLAEHFQVYILTRPSVLNPLCYTEKRIWVEQHMGIEWCEKLIICPNKSLMKGHYLIDDVEWPGFEGEQLLFGQGEFTTWLQVYTYIMYKEASREVGRDKE